MLDFEQNTDPKSGEIFIETSVSGKLLLTTPQLNKGTAFSDEERHTFDLTGKLPLRIESLEEQVKRAYQQFSSYQTNLKRNIYLNNLHDSNQVLFYKLVSEHMDEMIPTIYTPIVGVAVKQFSQEFRQPRGLYLSYTHADQLNEILENRSNPDIKLIVVTDGEGVLGIGDQGIGGMDIPVAKLMVYSLCGGINPCNTLPIFIDVGTNNQKLLDDPLYLGWRHERICGKEYDEFIDHFVTTVHQKFPDAFLHWEDFGRNNARHILELYQHKICTFNDDIQGTGAVTLSALLSAISVTGSTLAEQRIVIFGAGNAGVGITDQICAALPHHGLTEEEARACFYLIDRQGLLIEDTPETTKAQQPYLRDRVELENWQIENPQEITLLETIKNTKPTILIGCSAVAGAFNETIVTEMAKHVQHPIIFPLSNPTERAEAQPADLLQWTAGKALVATGTAFPTVEYKHKKIPVAQCNNALVFPGIGLGVLAVKAKYLTDMMIWKACAALSKCSPALTDPHNALLPALTEAQNVAKKIAIAVAKQAIKEGIAQENQDADLEAIINELYWKPEYLPMRLKQKLTAD